MRVLCVDHEERSLNEAVAICRENPAVDAVVGLGSAAEVLEWFKMNRVDFALIDVELPDKSGIDLAAELREMSPLLPIVFLAEDARLAYEAFRVYPQNYLLKPRTRPRTRAWTRAQTWASGFKTGTDQRSEKYGGENAPHGRDRRHIKTKPTKEPRRKTEG